MKPLQPATLNDTKNMRKYAPSKNFEETWMNDEYTVNVERHKVSGFTYPGGERPYLITWLSIKRNDRAAKPDWRAFQWIKNQLVGPENEGIEIYPAESRLVDGANQYHLWVFEDSDFRLPIGFETRLISEKSFFGETQRKFPDNRKPADLDYFHKFIEDHKNSVDNNTFKP